MPDDTQTAQAAQGQQDPGAMFRGLPPERQKALLGKMSSEQKQKLYVSLKAYKPPSYSTKLSSTEESGFQSWVKQNKIPWRESPTADYDMRGFWKAQQSGNPQAKRAANLHFPDTWKTPYHKTFSNESIYAKGADAAKAGHWEGDKYIPPVAVKPSSTVKSKAPAAPAAKPPTAPKGPSLWERTKEWATQPMVDKDSPLRMPSTVGRIAGEYFNKAADENIEKTNTFKAYIERGVGGTAEDYANLMDFMLSPLGAAQTASQFVPGAKLAGRVSGAVMSEEMVRKGAPLSDVGKNISYAMGLEGVDKAVFGIDDTKLKGKTTPESTQQTLYGLSGLTGVAEETLRGVKPESLRSYADKVYSKKLGVKPQEVATAPGLHTAKEVGFQTRWVNVKNAIQAKLDSIGPQIDAAATQAKAKGVVVQGLDKAIDAVYDPAIAEAKNIGGKAGAKKVTRLREEKVAAQTRIQQNRLTGKDEAVPLDYAKGIDPEMALAKKRAIMNRGWEPGDPEYVKALNRKLGHAFADALDKSVPEMQKLNARYAGLKDAVEAAATHVAANKVGLSGRLQGLLQNPTTLMMYGAAGLVAGGLGFGGKYAGVIGLKVLYDSLPSASARASLASWFADQISGDLPTKGGFAPPKKVQPGPQTPAPSGAPQAGPVTPQPASPVTAAGPRPSVVAPSASPQGIPASAARASSDAAFASRFPNGPVGANIDPTVLAQWQQSAFNEKPIGDPGAAARAQAPAVPRLGAGTPPVTKVPSGVSGIAPELKPYFDMIGDVMAKMDVAKTGLEKAALEKTFDNLKKILNPSTAVKERTELMKKVDKSMAKSEERATAAAKAPASAGPVGANVVEETGAKTYEPLAPTVDINAAIDRVSELEGKLRMFPGGDMMLKAFNKQFGKLDAPSRAAELLVMYDWMKQHPQDLKSLREAQPPKEKPDF